MPPAAEWPGVSRFNDLTAGIAGADVVMMLRLQKERMAEALGLVDEQYHQSFGLPASVLSARKPMWQGKRSRQPRPAP